MEEENKKEKTKKKMGVKFKLLIALIIIIALFFIILMIVSAFNRVEIKTYPVSDTVSEYLGKKVITNDYQGEYDIQELEDDNAEKNQKFKKNKDKYLETKVMNGIEYSLFCKKNGIKQKYYDFTKHYIVYSQLVDGCSPYARLAAVEYDGDDVRLYIHSLDHGSLLEVTAYIVVVPTDKNVKHVWKEKVYTKNDVYLENERRNNPSSFPVSFDDKPIIYLYPEQDAEVSVKLVNKDQIIVSYPKYVDGWKVLARKDGSLTDLDTNKNLYALYYESEAIVPAEIKEDGFVVKGEDTIEFLEEKLALLGLTEREAEEFIVYWLPRLQENKYNYIRFATMEEINENMPVEINPNPDTLIRVLMTYKGLDNPIDVEEQELVTPERTGFVAVEWGGTEIK